MQPRLPLDPHVRRVVDTLSLTQARAPAAVGLERRRAAFRGLMRLSETGSPVAGVEDRTLPGPAGPLAIRVYTPRDAPPGALPGVVYVHGGGFVCGDLDAYDALCRTLCDETGCRLIAVEYRLAPEHPFPAAVDDVHAATRWVLDHADALGLDPARIAIAGDSAGATLVAVACQLLAATHAGALAFQVLLCPILDWAGETASRLEFARGYLLDRGVIAEDLACYLAGGGDALHPRVSPLRAADLSGQPPAYIHTAEFDPARDEGGAYADRLRRAGVAAHHTLHRGMVHLFYGFGRLVPYARVAHRQIGAQVRAAFAWGGSIA
jgi:acetyl esterase/lipase